MAHDDPKAHLWSLIKDIRFGMLTTRHPNGHLHSRPMTTQNADLDEDTALWFFTSRSGEAVAELQRDPQVGLIYAHPGKDSYVAISGTARLVEDRAKMKALWSTMNEAWFPNGVDDPDLGLLRVDITHADYWDVKANKMVQLLRMAAAAVTGNPPTDLGEHRKVTM